MRTLWRVFALVALPAVLLAVWWFASADSKDFFLPPLSRILNSFDTVWTAQRWRADVLPSVLRLLAGYVAAAILGIAAGTVIGTSRKVRATTEPVLEFLRALPPPVLVPVIMLFAGIGTGMKIAVIISGCVWPVLLNTVEGVRAVDGVLTDTCTVYRVTGARRLFRLTLPAASPQIVTGLRQALSLGIILMVISEMFAASSGLGFTIVQFQRSFAIPGMWSGIILLGLLGVAMSVLFALFERWALAWYLGMRRTGGRE